MNNEEQNTEEVVEKKSFSILQYIEDNSKNLMYAGIALLVIAAGFWYYTSIYTPKQNSAANDELFRAEKYFEQDSLDLALNGDGGDALGLIDVAEEYGSTPAGARAKYLAARAYMNKESYDEALEYLSSVSFDDEMVAPLAKCLEGDCHVQLKNVEKGIELYLKAANMRDNSFTAPYCLMKAAKAQLSVEDYEGALKSFETIKKDYSKTQYAANIDKEIARARSAVNSTK